MRLNKCIIDFIVNKGTISKMLKQSYKTQFIKAVQTGRMPSCWHAINSVSYDREPGKTRGSYKCNE
jgi:hypothetical protein